MVCLMIKLQVIMVQLQYIGFDFHSNLNPKLENQFLNGLYRHHRFWPFTDTLKFSENWSYHISVIREFSVKSSREKWYSKEHVGEIRKVRIPKIRLNHMFHSKGGIWKNSLLTLCILYPTGFYCVKKPKRFVSLSFDKSSEKNLSCFFDMKKPRRIENLQN